jgi:L-asparaginase II
VGQHCQDGPVIADRAEVLAEVVRSDLVECVHLGHAILVDAQGEELAAWGNPDAVVFTRSANKPFQTMAMLGAGLQVPLRHLAMVTSSHSGEPFHLDAVTQLLTAEGLTADDLRTPPDFPLDATERRQWVRAGLSPSALAMNCSGKHAGMLATCLVNGWPLDDYRDPAHPLQQHITEYVAEFAGHPISAVGVDGCGAPVLALPLRALAQMVARLTTTPGPGQDVVSAMRTYPELIGGTRRDATAFMQSVPGLIAKDGADGVFIVGWPDGRALAVKMIDGGDRGRAAVVATLISEISGAPSILPEWRERAVLGGGRPVGMLRASAAVRRPFDGR